MQKSQGEAVTAHFPLPSRLSSLGSGASGAPTTEPRPQLTLRPKRLSPRGPSPSAAVWVHWWSRRCWGGRWDAHGVQMPRQLRDQLCLGFGVCARFSFV